jgi:hypothetical protein
VVHDRVFDRQRVQVELLDHDAEVGGGRVVEVQPHDGVRVLVEGLPDLVGGEPLGHEPPGPVHPGAVAHRGGTAVATLVATGPGDADHRNRRGSAICHGRRVSRPQTSTRRLPISRRASRAARTTVGCA